jgi:predicted Zn-dependent protease
MFTRDEAQKIAQKVIGYSTFPECQVSLMASEQAYTRFANNGITTASLGLRQDVSITVTRDAQSGSCTTGDLDDASMRAAVKKAEELASLAPPNAERLPALGPQQYPRTFDLDDRTAKARAPEMIPHIRTIVDIALKQKLVAAGLIERTHRVTAVANKSGLFGFHEAADSQLTTTIRMADGSSSGWAGQPSTRIAELDSAKLGAVASEKCARWKNPHQLDPGNYTVVLEPTAAADIVRLIEGGFSCRNTEEGRTFLSKPGGGTLLGEKLFPEYISLRSDPFDPRQPSSPWTAELLPSRPIAWIDKGVVANIA